MPLWGTEDTLEGKPKIHGRSFLSAVQAPGVVDPRTSIYATTSGWVQPGTGRGTTDPEVLVAIRGLSTRTGGAFKTTGELEANITSINFNFSTWSRAEGGTLSVSANFNEAVTVAGTPTLKVVNDTRADSVLLYSAALSTANRVTFTKPIGTNDAEIQAGNVLSIGLNAISMAGGSTIKDTASTNSAVFTNTGPGSGTIGYAAGTITATA